ncbi:hypothetical protein F7725_015044 [Dissostichus mawsoni]|uniref:Uncharacterized protein n=1 Tax=Dissostichus mawsoni TaxID=36200 RepID=A0A7J5YJ93_DISMA|nr:hypothetical protein F7725_015044 [Dissostichus mawsoni]
MIWKWLERRQAPSWTEETWRSPSSSSFWFCPCAARGGLCLRDTVQISLQPEASSDLPPPYRQITVETEFDNPLYETGGVSLRNNTNTVQRH